MRDVPTRSVCVSIIEIEDCLVSGQDDWPSSQAPAGLFLVNCRLVSVKLVLNHTQEFFSAGGGEKTTG